MQSKLFFDGCRCCDAFWLEDSLAGLCCHDVVQGLQACILLALSGTVRTTDAAE